MSKHIAVVGMACLLAAGCGGGAQTDRPVATTTSRGTSTSPSGDVTDDRGTSQVRLVSALPAAQRIDLASEKGVVFSAVPYKTVTPYKELTDNAAKFSIRSAGASSEPLAENNEAMADGHRFTLVALPEEKGKGAQLKAFRDEVVPEAGKVKVRVINAAPNTGELDVALSGHKDALFEDIDFGHEGGFKEIDPQSGTLQIRRDDADGKPGKVVNAGRMQFEAGRAYTLVVAGADPQRPDVIKFVDEQVGGPTAGTATDADGRSETSQTSGTAGSDAAVVPGGSTADQRTGTMDRARRNSTDEATPPTTGTERSKTASPSNQPS